MKEQAIDNYIERYARCRSISVEEASTHKIVSEYREYVEKMTNEEINRINSDGSRNSNSNNNMSVGSCG